MKTYSTTITKEEFVKELEAHQKAKKAVNLVSKKFKKLGFSVTETKSCTTNGPDLTAFKKSGAYRIEVKHAIFTARAWIVKPIARKEDDFVAVVFPSGDIHIDTMKDHLAACNKSRTMAMTMIGKLYE